MNKGTIIINGKTFPCLLAVTSKEQESGLMGVKPPVPTMAFIYNSPVQLKFWMKDTPSPLDIVFCRNNHIISIMNGQPYSTAMIGPSIATDLVVEFNAGTCNKNGISVGDKIVLES